MAAVQPREEFSRLYVEFVGSVSLREGYFETGLPRLGVQLYRPPFDTKYGPIILIFDLYSRTDPTETKPISQANLTPDEASKIAILLLKGVAKYRSLGPSDVVRHVREAWLS